MRKNWNLRGRLVAYGKRVAMITTIHEGGDHVTLTFVDDGEEPHLKYWVPVKDLR